MPRPPKPTQILKLSGAFRADRHANRVDADAPAAKCAPPSWISKRARAQFEEFATALEQITVGADAAALAMLVEALQMYAAARDEVIKNGLVLPTTDGFIQNPACRIEREAWGRVVVALRQFGLSPASRPTIQRPPADTGDTIANFFKKDNA